jgi:hypothetical protein
MAEENNTRLACEGNHIRVQSRPVIFEVGALRKSIARVLAVVKAFGQTLQSAAA